MTKRLKASLLLVIAVFLLGACSSSLKDEQKAAVSAAKETFYKKQKDPNKENDDIEFYLPFGVEIKEQSPNNIILKNGSKTYILFYNQQEGPESKIVYNSTVNGKQTYNVKKKFKKDEKFGFLLIRNVKDNRNELIAGIGGVKMTTESKTNNLEADAAMMMEIVNSVKVK